MRIAFVGIEKDWKDLYNRGYEGKFVKYHLELPYYYAKYGENRVTIVTDDPIQAYERQFSNISCIITMTPEDFKKTSHEYDVVVHWRKWFEELYKPEAVNVINSQDHSYSGEWLQKVNQATKEEKLYGILCFGGWHRDNLERELTIAPYAPKLLTGVTLGVDTETYTPSVKGRRELLWASDIGRGLFNGSFLSVAAELFKRDHGFKAHVCYPDYTDGERFTIGHPAIQLHKNLDNGPELWNLFNTCGFLPYTSTFKEPSSRAHRQAMAAGCVVLYPPDMGTPSGLITDGVNGFVRPVNEWVDIIWELSNNESKFNEISQNARTLALSENWEVQARRFNELFKGILK
ncbi:MAG: glycosyltransferase [Candidatus Thorarchaeota archaeon]|jgi:glycosyltransferase involved in cell wall biosynthesis